MQEDGPVSGNEMTTVHPMPWVPPEPRQLPDWRARMLEYRKSERGRNDLAMAIATGNTNMLPVFPATAPPQRPGSSRRSYPAPTSFRTW